MSGDILVVSSKIIAAITIASIPFSLAWIAICLNRITEYLEAEYCHCDKEEKK